MTINYDYNNMTLEEFKDNFPYAKIIGNGNIPLFTDKGLELFPYIVIGNCIYILTRKK